MTPEIYLQRVLDLVTSVSPILTAEEQGEVLHLIRHGEPAEGVRCLAWIITDEGKKVPAHTISLILELTEGIVDRCDLPPNLSDFAH